MKAKNLKRIYPKSLITTIIKKVILLEILKIKKTIYNFSNPNVGNYKFGGFTIHLLYSISGLISR